MHTCRIGDDISDPTPMQYGWLPEPGKAVGMVALTSGRAGEIAASKTYMVNCHEIMSEASI